MCCSGADRDHGTRDRTCAFETTIVGGATYPTVRTRLATRRRALFAMAADSIPTSVRAIDRARPIPLEQTAGEECAPEDGREDDIGAHAPMITWPMSSDATLPTRIQGTPIRSVVCTVVGGPDAGRAASDDDRVSVGTAEDNALVLGDRTVSRYHLEAKRSGDAIEIADLGSTNGTLAGPATFCASSVRVPSGTIVSLGATKLRVDDGDVRLEAIPDAPIGAMVGRSLAMRKLAGAIDSLAKKDVVVLVLGESGTGKELAARALHERGPRARGPFVVVDCGALPSPLLASELFGHERGAFTGADRRHAGAFERAHGGTIFLDEIGELSTEHQTSLLGVLERRQFRRLGGAAEIPVDVRVIAATHRDLRADVNHGRFRLDLYYRIAVVVLRTPPLRERTEDIPELIARFLVEEGVEEPIDRYFPENAVDALMRHAWPGNVRELRNLVASTVAIGAEPALDAAGAPAPATDPEELNYRDARRRALEEFERRFLTSLLAKCGGNIREASRRARMDRSYLMDLMRRHGLR
jgi:transcriptional regulator with AAA-type ATPase domain